MCLGVPGKVVEVMPQEAGETGVTMAKVSFGGVMKKVCLEHVPDAKAGDYVLVHVGFALSKIDEAEAKRIFEYLEAMEMLADELPPDPGGGTDRNPFGDPS